MKKDLTGNDIQSALEDTPESDQNGLVVVEERDRLEAKGFMPHHNPLCDFPCSRDYALDTFICKATKCVANRGGFCIAPSLCEIGEDGRCVNYKERDERS